jgi:oligopeptidase B
VRLRRLLRPLLYCGCLAAPGWAQSAPPAARRIPRVDTLHGDVRVDDYFWLRERANPEVIAHLEAENAWTARGMRHTEALQEQLYREIVGRIKQTDLSVPARKGKWEYFSRTAEGRDYPAFWRRPVGGGADELLLDQNVLAAGKAYLAVEQLDVSPDGRLLLFLQDTTAFREYTLYVKDLRSGALVDSIAGAWNGTAWADDSRTFFYLTADSAKRGNAVWRHAVGQPRAGDVNVFRDDDVLHNVGVSRSLSGRYVFLGSQGFTSSEWHVIPAARPSDPARVVAPRRPGVEYSVDDAGDRFLIRTNDAARNFRIVSATEKDPARWTDWQPGTDSVFVEGLQVFKRHVVVSQRRGGLQQFRVVPLDGRPAHELSFPDAAYALSPADNREFDTRTFRFVYQSPVSPPAVYDYDLDRRSRVLRKQQEIPSGFDPSRYEVRRLSVPVRDGAEVPVSMLLPKGFPRDGTRPLLLYAYGSYGASMDPWFSSSVLSLVERGFGYAVAHVRGGQEKGRAWYDDGKMLHKLNTFHDYIDVAEWLERERYTSPAGLVANGGSAGGLLMGAVANMRPDLFRAIVADVPFVDVITTMLDASLPLTAQEWEQWGNPLIAEQYAYMRRYSPYDNVARQAYPWLLVTTSLNDSQVLYHEPAKWVARLRALKTDEHPLYLRTLMAGGHGGSSGRYDRWREAAFRYAFMLDAVGLGGPVP